MGTKPASFPKKVFKIDCFIPRRLFSKDHEDGKMSIGSWNTGAAQRGVRICRESLLID
nr:MAG TPA: hypothetical protein [Caudoviricetes sp.]